jgi:SAM-dependent methyltransferase
MKKVKKINDSFWNKEYQQSKVGTEDLFNLSTKPSSDFLKFINWLEKVAGKGILNSKTFFVDAGCGNGRHSLYLFENFLCNGFAYDLSSQAILQAKGEYQKIKEKLKQNKSNIIFETQNINQKINLPDNSVDLIIDTMASHVLKEKERETFLQEILRVLSSGGYLYLKTFLRDGDTLSRDLLQKYPAEEKNSYIHPNIGIYEHVPSEKELTEKYSPFFEIEKVERSHFHKEKGKRRFIILYLRKK